MKTCKVFAVTGCQYEEDNNDRCSAVLTPFIQGKSNSQKLCYYFYANGKRIIINKIIKGDSCEKRWWGTKNVGRGEKNLAGVGESIVFGKGS